MKKMKEPPMGSVVMDIKGRAWQRHPVGWSISGGDGSWSYSWRQLLLELYTPSDSPATPLWEPAVGDPRLPFIIYVPHEELITGDEELKELG